MPPSYKRGPGRPKKLKRREPDEETQTRWQRTNTSHICKSCLEYGHNKRTCKKNKQLTGPTEGDVATENTVATERASDVATANIVATKRASDVAIDVATAV